MKKLISLILIFTMLISNPFQVLAQEITFKPAITFEYEYYEPGRDEEYKAEFKEKLRANLDNDYESATQADTSYRKDDIKYEGSKPTQLDYYNAYGTLDKVKEAYNDFLYFNAYPKQSPYYIDTALKTDKDTSKAFREEESDILYILNRYETVTEDIKSLLKNNPARDKDVTEMVVRKLPTIILLTILAFCSIEIYAGSSATAEAIAYMPYNAGMASLRSAKITSFLAKLGLFSTLTIADIWLTDYVAKESEKIDKRLGELVESVGFYRVMSDSVGDITLFSTAKYSGEADAEAKQTLRDTRFYRYFKFWKSWFNPGELDKKIAEAKIISEFYDNGQIKHTPENHKLIAGTLIMAYGKNQKGIPELTDENKDMVLELVYNQNQYAMDQVRQELLRNYYALRFIRAELSNINDPLRYDRAIIDLATTYKVMFVQSIDNRAIKGNDQSKQTLFPDALSNSRGIERETFYQENPHYQEYEGIDYMAPHVMDNIQYQGYNQRRYLEHELSNSREIPTDIGYDLFNGISSEDSYPTLLSRAQVNFIVQHISINERENEKRIIDDINARVAKRENKTGRQAEYDYLNNSNLTEGQKRAVRSNFGTR